MMPTISDVSTVEEWRLVAKDIIQQSGNVNLRATIVDWPGLGYSDRPKLDYDADVMESFLVDFILAPNSPINNMGECYIYDSVSRNHSLKCSPNEIDYHIFACSKILLLYNFVFGCRRRLSHCWRRSCCHNSYPCCK